MSERIPWEYRKTKRRTRILKCNTCKHNMRNTTNAGYWKCKENSWHSYNLNNNTCKNYKISEIIANKETQESYDSLVRNSK